MLIERGRQDSALRGMGSTLTAARSYGRDLLIVHVGDSRAYLFRAGHLERLTQDHTYAQMLVDTGHLSPDDVTLSGVRHILVNALGGSAEQSPLTLTCCASKTAIACCSAAMGSPTVSMTPRSRQRSAMHCPRARPASDSCSSRSMVAGATTSLPSSRPFDGSRQLQ